MYENILYFWEQLPFLIKWPISFAFQWVILRGLLGSDINTFLRQHGWGDGLFHTTGRIARKVLKRLLIPTQRKQAIWNHHKEQHPTKSIAGCTFESCQI